MIVLCLILRLYTYKFFLSQSLFFGGYIHMYSLHIWVRNGMMHGVLACHGMWCSLFPMELWKERLWLLRLEMLPVVLENPYTNRTIKQGKSKPTQSWMVQVLAMLFSFCACFLCVICIGISLISITRWRQASWCPRPYLKAKTQNVYTQRACQAS